MSKCCKQCGETKPLDQFNRKSATRDGLNEKCRPCWSIYLKAYRAGTLETIIGPRPAEGMKRCKVCKVEKPATTEHFHRHPTAKHGLANKCKPCNRASSSAWQRNNRPHANAYARDRHNSDPVVRMAHIVRCRIRDVLAGRQKSSATFDLVGYSPAQLVAHLERTFKRGMTWDNFGAWHVDHILPVSLFDHGDPDQIRQCWALTNLRAMWAPANLAKGVARVELI